MNGMSFGIEEAWWAPLAYVAFHTPLLVLARTGCSAVLAHQQGASRFSEKGSGGYSRTR